MKTISLWQPWATLMASGAKRIETRSWKPNGLKHGELLAIHAAKRWTAEERDICEDSPFRECLGEAAMRGLWDLDKPPLGCMVAVARFDRTVPTLGGGIDWDNMSDEEYAFGNYSAGRFAWFFSEVRPLLPISAKGAQGIFDWQPPTEFMYVEPRNPVKEAQ